MQLPTIPAFVAKFMLNSIFLTFLSEVVPLISNSKHFILYLCYANASYNYADGISNIFYILYWSKLLMTFLT